MRLEIREARPGDGAALHAMMLALAHSHDLASHVTAIPQDFEDALFCKSPIIGALIAEVDGVAAGSALWHRSFGSFRGKEVMYLEDLSVLPEFRRRGVGQALLKAVAQLAVSKGFPSIYWMMMGWNDGARALYEAVGAEIEGDMCYCRIHGEALERLAR
ncbi:MAG: GNAT family N-acetyltransferase [Alphaproteobacteria bacterium]|nr:GNAT family N-acetyltransferase [Alphaproteobacteria bacterium]